MWQFWMPLWIGRVSYGKFKKNVSTFLTLLVFYLIHFIKNDQITHFLFLCEILLWFSKSFKFLHNLKLKKSWWRFIFAQERERKKNVFLRVTFFQLNKRLAAKKHRGQHWHCLHKPQGESRLNSGSRSSDSLTLAWHDVQLSFRNSRCTWTPVLFQRQVSLPSSLN